MFTRPVPAFFAALLAITSTAAAQQQPQPNPDATDRSPAALYASMCASCHGVNHQGGNASSLADKTWLYGKSDNYIARNIKHGILTMGMPAYGETMSDAEIREMVAYLREQEQKAPVAPPPVPDVVQTEHHRYRVETVAEDLNTPWAIQWTPDGRRALITEKRGTLRLFEDGKLHPDPIADTPKVLVHGQGGLMDVAIDPDFATNGWVYLAYTHELQPTLGGERVRRPLAMTRIVRGKLRDHRWTDEQVLFEAKPDHYLPAGVHFGCRIVFDGQGHLFFAIGDRGEMKMAQDLTRPNGKVHRINTDGSIPDDNPFVDRADAYKSIYSYGNRNIQGMAIHPVSGDLWATEHGPMGGDELNLILPGRNYGWPVITYGINYNGQPITDKTKQEGMEQPVINWTPSIAACGLDAYTGEPFERWNNDLLAGALKFEEVRRVRIENRRAIADEVILKGRGRVRDVSAGPDGYVYVVLNDPGKVIRLVPADEGTAP